MITVSLAFLLIFPILHPHMTAAQPQSTNPAVCEYQEKRVPVPSNPETNEPYVPDQRNQEPFDGGSISKDEIRQCLQAKASIKNHHIVFDDYWQAWASLAKETRDYAIPLRIEGGVLHAPAYDEQANTGGIGLWKFRDPNVSSGSDLTEEERKAFRIKHQNTPIALIRSPVSWNAVLIDSAVIPYGKDRQNTNEIISIIFNAEANFSSSTFNAEANFSSSTFNAEAIFSSSIFNSRSDFSDSTFDAKSDFFISTFNSRSDFSDSIFNEESSFYISTFNAEAIFIRSTFNAEAHFSRSTFNAEAIFVVSTFDAEFYCSSSTFNAEANFHSSTFKAKADFGYTRFKNNTDFRNIKVNSDQLVFNNTAWEKRTDLRRMSVKDLQWDSTENPSDVKGTVDFRDALIGSATVKEVRFQDLVDFSRMTVGQYGERIEDSPPKAEREEQNVFWASHPLMHFENNTFENEADFLHIKLYGPIRLIRNRFRSTFDLTGTRFEAKQSGHPNPPAIKPHLCLSYNRIHRFVFESQHLDRVKSVEAPECQKPADSVNASDRLNQSPEPLPSLYKSLEKAFSDANDRKGVNEAWYLGVVASRWREINYL